MFSRLRRIVLLLLACTTTIYAHASKSLVSVGTSPGGLSFEVDGVTYTSAQLFSWKVGSQHTIVAATQTNSAATIEYSFEEWKQETLGGTASSSTSGTLTITVASDIATFTAKFSDLYQLAIAASNTHGTFTPASGSYYTPGTQVAIGATPAGGYYFSGWTGSTDIASSTTADTTITMTTPESIVANFKKSGGTQYFGIAYIVTTAADDAVGVPGNCPLGGPATGGGQNCSLRDALAAGGGSVTFDSEVFASTNPAAKNTITLIGGPLVVPDYTTIGGPTVLHGKTQANIVTIDANGQSTAFWVAKGSKSVEIDNLNIVNGSGGFGGGIYTDGRLRVMGTTISGSASPGGQGGGIYVDANGALTLLNSTVSGNSADTGGGIANFGTLNIAASTISGNSATSDAAGIFQNGQAILAATTISANKSSGAVGGLEISLPGTTILKNSIVAANSAVSVPPDIVGDYTDEGGNQVATWVNLAPLGNYGGPTQTQIPLPWSPAICTGLSSNISPVVSTDQRGLPGINVTYPGYTGAAPCVDSGAVQTNYALTFSAQPSPIGPASSIAINTPFTAAVTVWESGSAFNVPVAVPLTLMGTGTLTGSSATTASGIATYPALMVSGVATGDVLSASLALNPPSSPAPLAITAGSNGFNVVSLATTTAAAGATTAFTGAAQIVPLTATVTSPSETVNAGTVTFAVMSGSAAIGASVTSAAISSGAAIANYVLPASAPPGTYTIDAAYNAAGGFTASTDATHTLTVTPAASATTLTSSTGDANLGANVTFTAVVTGSAAVAPTGSVKFMEGTTALGSGTLNGQGVATYQTGSLSAGTHHLTAVYSGDTNFAGSTSIAFAQSVTAPSFTLSADPPTLSVASGSSGNVTFTLTPVGGFHGTLKFACSQLPVNASCAFSPATLAPDGSNTPLTTTLTVNTGISMTATAAAPGRNGAPRNGTALAGFLWLPVVPLGLVLALRRKKLRALLYLLIAGLALAPFTAFTACGGGGGKLITPAGQYSVLITASPSGSSGAEAITLTLTVTQ